MKELEAIMGKNALDESAKNELTEDEMKKVSIIMILSIILKKILYGITKNRKMI